MIRTIKFKGRTGRFQTPSFLWTENEPLLLKFDISENRVGKYVVLVQCGEQKKTVYLGKDMTVEILPSFIKDGEFNPVYIYLEFRNLQGDKVIIPNNPAKNGFFIEPLYIEKVTGNVTFQAWASKIEEQLTQIKQEQTAMSSRMKQFEDEGVSLVAEVNEEIKGE